MLPLVQNKSHQQSSEILLQEKKLPLVEKKHSVTSLHRSAARHLERWNEPNHTFELKQRKNTSVIRRGMVSFRAKLDVHGHRENENFTQQHRQNLPLLQSTNVLSASALGLGWVQIQIWKDTSHVPSVLLLLE